jgi:type I restriction enzyme S subunit
VVQRAIEQQERLLALTTELKKALLHQLFSAGLRSEPLKQTEIGPVPESWKIKHFEQLATLQRGFDLPRDQFCEGPYPVIGATTTIGYHDQWNVKGPGVTVVRSGSSAGKAQFVPTDFWAHNVVLFVKDFHGNHPKFTYYKIQSLDLTKYREGVAVPTLNRNSFRIIPVAVPERSEQDEFVKVLDSVESKEQFHRRKQATLTDLFRTLLHQLITAQIRVHDLDLSELESKG